MSGRIQNLNNNEQMNRYARQTSLPEIGEAGQEKLRNAKVLIVGVGGLGSPIALYLAGAGVGTLGLVDDDQVSISNLQRQVLYAEADLGQPKPLCGARRVQGLNSDVNVEVYPFRLDKKNAGELIRNYDIVVPPGTDRGHDIQEDQQDHENRHAQADGRPVAEPFQRRGLIQGIHGAAHRGEVGSRRDPAADGQGDARSGLVGNGSGEGGRLLGGSFRNMAF